MERGKQICETLKGIRSEIARANGIDYHPTECTHEGDCAGTCPKCESELRWLERQLSLRRKLGKAVKVAGVTLAVGAIATSCDFGRHMTTRGKVEMTEGMVYMPDSAMVCQPADSTETLLEGDVVVEQPDTIGTEPATPAE